tara:strand:- start:55 stop:534 length:480 start_codon:yes stop_codon:yes gene_type:complete
MKFEEEILIFPSCLSNETDYLHLRDGSICPLIKSLLEKRFSFDLDVSLIGYNSRRVASNSLNIPLKFWDLISSEEGVELYRVHLIGSNSSLEKNSTLERDHDFELILEDYQRMTEHSLIDEIRGRATLTVADPSDYDKALNLIRVVPGLVESAYRKTDD